MKVKENIMYMAKLIGLGAVAAVNAQDPTGTTYRRKPRSLVLAVTVAVVAIGIVFVVTSSSARTAGAPRRAKPVRIEVFAPERGANAGANGFGWFVDMEVDFLGRNLQQAGFTGLQLTGPGVHTNALPFPGLASPGQDDRLPGLVVLTSTTIGPEVNPAFSGPGTNLANLFNLTGITNRDDKETELWDTWIVAAAIAGKDVDTTLTVAVIDDLNHDGIFNDAPNVVTDLNGDGRIDAEDLEMLGVASNIVTVPFRINGAPAQP